MSVCKLLARALILSVETLANQFNRPFACRYGAGSWESGKLFDIFAMPEQFILNRLSDKLLRISCKQLNDVAVNSGVSTAKETDLRTLLYFLSIKGYTRKKVDAGKRESGTAIILLDVILKHINQLPQL